MQIFILSLLAVTAAVYGSTTPSQNASEELTVTEISQSGEATVRYDLVDEPRTILPERRALDLNPPEKNEAATEDLFKKFGSDYFLNEERNLSVPETIRTTGVIQKVGRTSTPAAAVVEEATLAERVLDSLSMPVVRPVSGVEWLLNVYNPHQWQPHKLPGGQTLTPACQVDLLTYLTALRNGSIWAAKSEYQAQYIFNLTIRVKVAPSH